MPSATPVVYIVDDDPSVRESLELLIRTEGWRPETFSSADDFLAHPHDPCPSCLILDVSLPGLNGLDLQKRIADRIETPIVFITGHGDVSQSVQAMKAGAAEFLTKPFDSGVLLDAIRNAFRTSQDAIAQAAEIRLLRDRYAALSPREREVMQLIVAGLLNKQAADQLGISEITVKAHRGKVMQKMQATSFADLVKMSIKLELVLEARS